MFHSYFNEYAFDGINTALSEKSEYGKMKNMLILRPLNLDFYLRFGDHPFLNLIPVHLRCKIIFSQMR